MKTNRIPSFDDLAVFLAVCQAGGFRAAAPQLGLAPSHVSDAIARLEAQLALPLFTRNARSVMPTEAGCAGCPDGAAICRTTIASTFRATPPALRAFIDFVALHRVD